LGDSNLPNQLNPNWAGPLKVVYDRNKQISLINEHIDRLKFVINKYKHKLSDNSTRLSIEMVATAYLSEYIFCFKDQAFEGEHEWRVIGWYNEQKMMRSGMSRKTFLTSLPIEYLPAHNCVKPFLRFKITTDMLKQVILSSTVQASSIPLDAVKDYLEINDFHSNIDFSMVQFR
jgi:hypothetical protein